MHNIKTNVRSDSVRGKILCLSSRGRRSGGAADARGQNKNWDAPLSTYHIISYHIVSYHIISSQIISYHSIP